jgi:NADPH:quinone reductase-like Zn-dependent oxidoreductase
MKAVRMHRTGGPDVLQVDEVADPRAPVGDEILVRTAASSVNGTDLGLRRGGMRVATVGRMPFTLGFDLSGTVERCGPDVTAFSPGDRVVALLDHGGGAQAELVRVRQGRAAAAPRSLDLVDAAGLPLAGLTALQALHRHGHLHLRPAGTRVLVVGATGGIGSFGVQLAALAGAHVTALARRSALAAASALGAHELMAREDGLEGHAGRWDVVLDTPGTMPAAAAVALLRDSGVVISTRPVSRDALLARVRPRRLQGARRYASVMTAGRSADLARLARLVDDGRLRVPVDSVHPFQDTHLAHRRAESSPSGKVIVRTVP